VRAARCAVLVLALLPAAGCVVLGSKYEAKTREAETLRDAVAAANREKAALEARLEGMRRQLAEEQALSASLQARLKEQEEAARKASEELAAVRKNYEGTRLTREQLIAELLEKEKASGRRIQELLQRAQACEERQAALAKEVEARDAAIAGLKAQGERAAEAESLRRERDILLGRVERIREERAAELKRRDERLAALAEQLPRAVPGVGVTVSGGVARVEIPEKILLSRRGTVSEAGKEAVVQAGKAAAEFPGSSVAVLAPARTAERIRTLLSTEAGLAGARVVTSPRNQDRGAELYLLVP